MATPRQRPPAPVAGALVPPLPPDVRAALAEIAGEPFAAAMAAQVWPVALALFDDFKNQDSPAQRRAWLERADRKFAVEMRVDGEKRKRARRAALLFIAQLPPEVLTAIAIPPPTRASARHWRAAIRAVLDDPVKHPTIALPQRKGRPKGAGPLAASAEIARLSLPIFEAAGIAPATGVLRLLGAAAADAVGLKPLSLRHWQRALRDAVAAA